MAQRPLAAKFAKPPKANSAAGGHGAKPSRSTAGKSLRQPPGLTMLVHGLPQHIAPSRLLSEFPTALTAEATYDATSGVRTSIVLTFESRQPPANRKSAALGCVLQPVVTPPIGKPQSRVVSWYRKDGAVRQRRVESDGKVILTHRMLP